MELTNKMMMIEIIYEIFNSSIKMIIDKFIFLIVSRTNKYLN
jgi:hypothetical protein